MAFSKGDRVRHPTKPEWGLGEVLEGASTEEVQVFFVGKGTMSVKLRYAPLVLVEGPEAAHPVLDNLGTDKKGKTRPYKNLAMVIDEFLREFPGGFYGEDYADRERAYKVDAGRVLEESLSEKQLGDLLAERSHEEVGRRAVKVVNATNLIFPNEKMSFKDGLAKDPKRFAEALFGLLYLPGDFQPRFENFSGCLMDMGSGKWTVCTYFPFLAFPAEHMFLKPVVTQQAAGVCGFDLNYRPELNWLTYRKLLEFSRYLFRELAALRPRDMIDVQSFIWCTGRLAEGQYD